MEFVGACLCGAGGRAVPIIYNAPTNLIMDQLAAVNGIIFPGGEADLSPTAPYGRTAKLVFDKGMEFIQNGESFPMHGTCLGLEVCFALIET